MDKKKHQKSTQFYIWTLILLFGITIISSGEAFSQEATGDQSKISIYVDGKKLNWGTPPFIKQNTTFVPIRDFVKGINAQLEWNAAKGIVTIRRGNNTLIHQIGTNTLTLNGLQMKMNTSSQIVAHTTFIPIRDLAKALDASIDFWITTEWTMINLNLEKENDRSLSGDLAGIDTYLRSQRYTGTVLIAQQGHILLDKGYGPAGGGTMNAPEMKTRIASISKQFTAAAIQKLAETGKLNLNDSVEKFISDFPRASDITLHMLLSHTSGLPAEIPRVQGASLEETVEAVKKMELHFEPGTHYKYSNPGYVLLAYIIQQKSGMSYENYLRQTIFEPLGMLDTGEATVETETIKGHRMENGRLAETEYYVSQSGTGSLFSTVYDLLKWDQALYTERILSQSSIDRMFTPSPQKDNYGYGWEIEQINGSKIVSTSGGGKGYTTVISRDLANETVIILLANQEKLDIKNILSEVRSLLSRGDSS